MASSSSHFHTIIVGAGLSGLQCAVKLHQSGVSVLVLEARDRVGGKTWSVDFAGGKADMGAAWINDTNQSHMYALSRQFKLETITQNTTGSIIMHDLDGSVHTFPYGSTPQQEVEAGGVNDMVRVRDLFEELCQRIDIRDPVGSVKKLDGVHDGMSMRDFVVFANGGETAMRTVGIWTRAMLGLEPEEVGALFFLTYCKSGGGLMSMRSDRRDGGQFLRLAKGEPSTDEEECAYAQG
jgi:monoamine oxidase